MLISAVEPFAQQLRREGASVATRFAPSPNGPLHLGHAWAAIAAHDFARAAGGRFLLRVEDIDGTRSRPEHIAAILADMEWLGLAWDGPVIYQSQRTASYAAALERLKSAGLMYPCICSRSDIAAALKRRPVRHGPDGPHYPQSCKGKDIDLKLPHCWRLDMQATCDIAGPLTWRDLQSGVQSADPAAFGDIVLWRKDAPASYHLAATLDDHADGITHVVRGRDLFAYSALHRLLQSLLSLSQPVWWHHGLLLDLKGEKLSKSRASEGLNGLRAQGVDGRMLADQLRRGELPLGIGRSTS